MNEILNDGVNVIRKDRPRNTTPAYDSSDHTVDEVKAYVGDDADKARKVLESGEARVTLVAHLEALLPYETADYTVDEVKDYVGDDADLAQEALDSESARGDDARSTLVEHLEGVVKAKADADAAEAQKTQEAQAAAAQESGTDQATGNADGTDALL